MSEFPSARPSAPLEQAPKRGRGRPRTRVKPLALRDWRGESRYQLWLASPPPHQQRESALVLRILAAIRARAKEAGFVGGRGGVSWVAFAKEAGLQKTQLALMLSGKQRMPLHIAVQAAMAVGLRLELVDDLGPDGSADT